MSRFTNNLDLAKEAGNGNRKKTTKSRKQSTENRNKKNKKAKVPNPNQPNANPPPSTEPIPNKSSPRNPTSNTRNQARKRAAQSPDTMHQAINSNKPVPESQLASKTPVVKKQPAPTAPVVTPNTPNTPNKTGRDAKIRKASNLLGDIRTKKTSRVDDAGKARRAKNITKAADRIKRPTAKTTPPTKGTPGGGTTRANPNSTSGFDMKSIDTKNTPGPTVKAGGGGYDMKSIDTKKTPGVKPGTPSTKPITPSGGGGKWKMGLGLLGAAGAGVGAKIGYDKYNEK